MIQYPRYRQHRFSSFQVIIAGFAAVDLVGALLLMLPIAAQQRCVTPFHEALFTSTSALCVTGLVVQDTGSYWSAFGQSVILLLIQIGGLGVITVGAAFALLSGRKISLKQRSTMQEAIAAPNVGGVVRLTGLFCGSPPCLNWPVLHCCCRHFAPIMVCAGSGTRCFIPFRRSAMPALTCWEQRVQNLFR